MVKIFHLADIHIKNFKSHSSYNKSFDLLYKEIEMEKPDYVVIAGDIAHSKTNISPEFIEMTSNFFKNIADRTKLVLMLGNHDGTLRNLNRQDAITPIVNALNHKNIILQKFSGEIIEKDITFNVMSEFDKESWIGPTDLDKINISLYHGTIHGSKTDSDFELEFGDQKEVLFGHDYALLGDIHKQQQVTEQSFQYKEIEESEIDYFLNKGWEIYE